MRCKDGKLLQLLNLCFALWNEDAYTKNDAALQIEFARLRFLYFLEETDQRR